MAFTDESSNVPTGWAWDFQADGTIDSTVRHPTFVYTAPGTYSVRLSVTNATGSNALTRTAYVVVASTGGTGTTTFQATADAQVKSTSATGNYGSAATLRLRLASDIYRSYVKFTVAGVGGDVTAAKLRLHVADAGPDGGRVHLVANTWTESGITWNNAPAIGGTPLSSVGAVTLGTWAEFDVSSAVGGNGTYSFGLLNSNGDSVLYTSKEGLEPPELVLTIAGQGTPAPVADFDSVPTSGTAPLTVQFTDDSQNGPTSWAWDFQNDGVIDSNLRNPRFTYSAPGAYSVRLVVTNGGGSHSLVRSSYITVGAGPVAGPSDATLLAAGDIATCSATTDSATADLIAGIPGTVATLGDVVLSNGAASLYTNCYEPSWGAHKARTRPAVGNHEYEQAGAAPYYAYFGAAAGESTKGYYSYDLGEWHVVVLNSNCSVVSCAAGSAQETWLRQDLAANADACTLAYFHHPRFSSGLGGNNTSVGPLWQALDADGADVVLNGHNHYYERFAPQTAAGAADPEGIREFIAGTGGHPLVSYGAIHPNSEIRHNQSHGVLRLTLHANGYTWQFVPIAGQTFTDTGSGFCH